MFFIERFHSTITSELRIPLSNKGCIQYSMLYGGGGYMLCLIDITDYRLI